jgi:DNA-dependent protein kinase catalytic subunit
MLREFTSAAHKHQAGRALAVWSEYRSAWLTGKKDGAPHRADVGPINALFIRKYRKQIEALFAEVTRTNSLPSAAGVKELNAKGKQLVQDVMQDREMGSKRKVGTQSLSSYSQWLTSFLSHATALHEEVEVPGQYGGDCQPMPEQHVRIKGFARDVLVLNSIRKPKRLTLLGSDEAEYPYLLKGGEDLRLDERIEQLFGAMNDILASDRRCSARHLSLMTYAVVPLTPKLGWIEWLPDTIPVKALIRDVAGAEVVEQSLRAMMDMIARLAPTAKGNDAQNEIIEKVTPARLAKEFKPLLELMPCDLFSRYLLGLSSCPEAFLVLRSRLAHSFAAVSISQYVLGIGDRHTDNFLFHRRTGQLAAIDFGMAFGQGALLPIPELMPIRFTRQFQHILTPLQTTVMVCDDMEIVMDAFHAGQQRLLTMMEVFVNEPHIEWIEAAKSKQQQRQAAQQPQQDQQSSPSALVMTSSSLDTSLVWYPRRKLAIARVKLNAANPCEVTKEELQDNNLFTLPQRKGLQAACNRVVDGSDVDSRRSRVGRWCSGVREQVECLIEQATDINVLGRTYMGWTPQW